MRIVNLALALRAGETGPVPGYSGAARSAQRMIARDTHFLHELGFHADAAAEPIELRAEQSDLVAFAAACALTGDLARAGRRAWLKLSTTSALVRGDRMVAVPDITELSLDDFAIMLTALAHHRRVSCTYGHAWEPTPRVLEPWDLVARHGRWYLTGFDIDRQAVRTFRLARLTGFEDLGPATHPRTEDAWKEKAEMVTAEVRSETPPDIPAGALKETSPSTWRLTGVEPARLVDWALRTGGVILSPAKPREYVIHSIQTLMTALDNAETWELPPALTGVGREHTVHDVPDLPAPVEDRVVRLLCIPPFLAAHPGVSVFEAAEHFGVTPQVLSQDIAELCQCGRRDLAGGELIDIDANPRALTLVDDQGLGLCLSITSLEAAVLLFAIETVHSTPGVIEEEVVAPVVELLRKAAGEMGQCIRSEYTEPGTGGAVRPVENREIAGQRSVLSGEPEDQGARYKDSHSESAENLLSNPGATLAQLNGLIAAGVQVELRYSNGRHYILHPVDTMIVDGHAYLRAIEGDPKRQRAWLLTHMKRFRLDRIESVSTHTVGGRPMPAKPLRSVVGPAHPLDPFSFETSKNWHRVWMGQRWLLNYEQVWEVGEFRDGVVVDFPGRIEWVVERIVRSGGALIPLEPAEMKKLVRDRAQAIAAEYCGHSDTAVQSHPEPSP